MNKARWSIRRRPLKIFLCYRREDSVDSTGRLYKDLKLYFHRPFRNYLRRRVALIRDFDSIPGGTNFEEYIKAEITTGAAFLAIIGKEWLGVDQKTGGRRIDSPQDHVRTEITTALSRSIPVIPILVKGAAMPTAEVLPQDLKTLASINARPVDEPGWDADVEAVIKDLELILYSPWSRFGWIALVACVAVGLAVLSVFAYRKCCTDTVVIEASATPTITPPANISSSPTTTATPLALTASPSPLPTTTPTPAAVASPAASPTAPPVHPLKGRAWDYDLLDSQGKPFHGYVISFDANDSFVYRCNKEKYPKCPHGNWFPSDAASVERKWYLDGNKVTIFFNKDTGNNAAKDEGVIEPGGLRMSGVTIRNGIIEGRWIATRRE